VQKKAVPHFKAGKEMRDRLNKGAEPKLSAPPPGQ